MENILYAIVEFIAKIHNYILSLNDNYEYNFTDKELHFLVIGVLGMALIFAIHPIFNWLAKHDHVMVVTWIYVATVILVLTFAIEIGQKITNTGTMDFADIVMGIFGFVIMFAIFAVVRAVIKHIMRLVKEH